MSAADRKRTERARKSKEGLKRVEVWVPAGKEQEIRDLAAKLRR